MTIRGKKMAIITLSFAASFALYAGYSEYANLKNRLRQIEANQDALTKTTYDLLKRVEKLEPKTAASDNPYDAILNKTDRARENTIKSMELDRLNRRVSELEDAERIRIISQPQN